MINESEVVQRIIEIEALVDLDDEFSYHDEGQQAELMVLYWVLDRELNDQETDRLNQQRLNVLGISDD